MATPETKLERFASLRWYSSSVTFLFSFLAITSEPLLAAGVVLSAIDFLQRGQLLAHNPMLAGAWSIAQGLAMEVSVGPVLINALHARKEADPVKMRLYGILTAFLFMVGGAMLFLQFTESIMGVQEAQLPGAILISLFAARTVASLGYIALACTKRVRFSGVSPVSPETPAPISDGTIQLILAKLAKLDQLEQVLSTQTVTVLPVSETPLALPETVSETPETPSETGQIVYQSPDTDNQSTDNEPDEPALEAQISALLLIKQDLSSREVATIVGRPHSTVYRALSKVKQQSKQSETLAVSNETPDK